MRYLLKKHDFYLVKNWSLISSELQKENKYLRKFSRQWQTNNSSFEEPPYWWLGHQQNKFRKQNVKIVLSKNHSQHTYNPGQQQHQNRYRSQFQGYQGRTFSFKSSTTKEKFLELPSVLQCKQSASTCKDPVSKKSNSRITSSRETKILLFKMGQTYTRSEYPKYSWRIRDSLSQKPCAGKFTHPPVLNQE